SRSTSVACITCPRTYVPWDGPEDADTPLEDRAGAVCCRRGQHPFSPPVCCKPELPASCNGRAHRRAAQNLEPILTLPTLPTRREDGQVGWPRGQPPIDRLRRLNRGCGW